MLRPILAAPLLLVLSVTGVTRADTTGEAAAPATSGVRRGEDRAVPTPAPRVFTNTSEVEDVVASGDRLYAATRGGIDVFDGTTLAWLRVYTTADGLDDNQVLQVGSDARGLFARTSGSLCRLHDDRVRCQPAPAALAGATPATAMTFRGARVTRRYHAGGHHLIATAGLGLWLDGARPRRLTPEGQICGNHIMAFARFQGRVWLGGFDTGICSHDGQRFHQPTVPFRMVNDLLADGHALWVAASEGLFRTRDGERFERVQLRRTDPTSGYNHLALDGDTILATTPGALLRIRGRRIRTAWTPLGTHAIQSVSVAAGAIWLATEDRGVLRLEKSSPGSTITGAIYDRAAGLPSSWAVDVAATHDGSAWIATFRDGLVHLSANGTFEVAGVPDPQLLHVQPDTHGGGLWIGTQGGAGHLAPSGKFTPIADLPDPCVHDILDDNEHLWVGTENGTLVLTTE